jgi:hypothetical protein
MSEGKLGITDKLEVKLVRSDGRVIAHRCLPSLWDKFERGVIDAGLETIMPFATRITMRHRDRYGNVVDHSKTHEVLSNGDIDLGPGLVTNVGVNFMAWNDATSVLGAALSNFQYHAIGTGVTADAATDYFLQTNNGATNLSGTTNGWMTGAPTVTAPNQIVTSATFTATGAIAVTEWALGMNNAAGVLRTSAGAAPTATTFTDTGAAFTTAGNGLKGFSIEIASTAINTPTTTVQGLITANTATVLTLAGGWWTLANASGSTPGATVAYVVYPTIFDRKQFAVVNLTNGNTLQTILTLTINSGG